MNLEKLKDEIISDEGFKTEAYRDHLDLWTIGVGHLIKDGEEWLIDTRMSEQDVYIMLEKDIEIVVNELDRHLPELRCLPDEIQHVIINMGFNLGVPRLLKFKKTIAAFLDKNWLIAANEMLDSKWAKQVPNRANRLADRVRNLA